MILILSILILSIFLTVNRSHVGINPLITFKDALEVPSIAGDTEQINSVDEWDISHINPNTNIHGTWFNPSCFPSRSAYK